MVLDTASINFGIAKLSQAFTAIQPKITALTEQYIQYKVFEQVLWASIWLLGIIICASIFIPVGITVFRKYMHDMPSDKEWIGFLLVFSGLGLFLFICLFITMAPDALLALKFPTMFVVSKFIGQ